MNAVHFGLDKSTGFYEKLSVLLAFAENLFRKRYNHPLSAVQQEYARGLSAFANHMGSASPEIQSWAKKFAAPNPPRKSFRYLLEAAIDECKALGMQVNNEITVEEIKRIRNELFHGDFFLNDFDGNRLVLLSEFILSLIELITVKDIGFVPGEDYFARHDRHSCQLGIFNTERKND